MPSVDSVNKTYAHSACPVPGSVLGAENTVVSKTDEVPLLMTLLFYGGCQKLMQDSE